MKPKSVAIFTEGGRNIGFGHLSRCLAVAQAFKERGTVSKFVVNSDDLVLDILEGNEYRLADWQQSNSHMAEDLACSSDIVVIDSYLADKSLYEKISKVANCLIMIDDYNRLEYPRGIVVNPSIYGDKLNYPQKNGMIYLLGRDYIIVRKKFWMNFNKKINKEVKNILITFGAMGHSDLTGEIINFCKKRLDFNFFVIEPNKNKLDLHKIIDLMLESDICISGGGQTAYELARMGVPTIGICFAENQQLNLEELSKTGFIQYVGWNNNSHLLENISQAIDKLLPEKSRSLISKIGKGLVDGKGPQRLAGYALDVYAYKN